MSPRNDVAIYSPFAFRFYEDPEGDALRVRRGGGGAELQASLLARTLAGDGLRVAHIVYPVSILMRPPPGLEVVQRPARGTQGLGARGALAEVALLWRALTAADARLYAFRTGLSGEILPFAVGAAFCLLRRRRLVLAASNDLDFIFDSDEGQARAGGRARRKLVIAAYRRALARARRIVVQSAQQLGLARAAIRDPDRIVMIPSFTQPAEPAAGGEAPGAFVWIGRMVDYKQPLAFLNLARALPEMRFVMVAKRSTRTSVAYEEEITGEADRLPNLEFMTFQPRERVLELIDRAVAVVGTSQHEGMPNVFLEAWARAVPVLTLHFDPDGRIAAEGIGVSAESDRERFVAAAKRLWDDRAYRDELGANGRAYVQRTHGLDAVGARWIALLRDVLAE